MATFSSVTYIAFVGLAIQDSYSPLLEAKDWSFYHYYHTTQLNSFAMTVSIMMSVFLIAAIIIAFLAYREFKALFYENVGAAGQSFIPSFGRGGG